MVGITDIAADLTKRLETVGSIKNSTVANAMKHIKNGGIEPIIYPNHVHLHSDTRNLYHKTRVSMEDGVQIRSAYLDIKRREHQTEHNISTVQPGMISISKDVIIDFKNAIDSAEAKGEGKGENYSGFANLKSAANEIMVNSYVDASTHGYVDVYAMADGKRWSSRDGVIIADLVIIPSDTPSNKDVAQLISTIIIALDANTQEGVNKALEIMGGFLGRDISGSTKDKKKPPEKEQPKTPPKEK